MKLTKQQLKQLIKEELQHVLNEIDRGRGSAVQREAEDKDIRPALDDVLGAAFKLSDAQGQLTIKLGDKGYWREGPWYELARASHTPVMLAKKILNMD